MLFCFILVLKLVLGIIPRKSSFDSTSSFIYSSAPISVILIILNLIPFKNATKQDPRRPKNKDYIHTHQRRKVPRRTQSLIQAINHLTYELQFCPRSRSMSLLAYCYYMSQDFLNSARVYEQLSKFYPEVTDYKLYLAQSHYKNGDL